VSGTEGFDERRQPTAPASLVRTAVRGYWVTRYLAEAHSSLLREQLTGSAAGAAVESHLAAGLGLRVGDFWPEMETQLLSRYAQDT
jgi:hypothetical protein